MIIQYLARKRWLAYTVEGRREGCLYGWIFERRRPQRRIWIALEPAAGRSSWHLADIYRADVHRARLGSDGYCGFVIPLDADDTRSVRLQVDRPRCLIEYRPESGHANDLEISAIGDLLFQLDPTARPISGWLSSLNEPHHRRVLRVEVEGQPALEQRACLFRENGPPQALGDPFHGFSIPLPMHVGGMKLSDAESGRLLHVSRR